MEERPKSDQMPLTTCRVNGNSVARTRDSRTKAVTVKQEMVEESTPSCRNDLSTAQQHFDNCLQDVRTELALSGARREDQAENFGNRVVPEIGIMELPEFVDSQLGIRHVRLADYVDFLTDPLPPADKSPVKVRPVFVDSSSFRWSAGC